MPEKTNENKELKEKKETVAKKGTKSSSSTASKKPAKSSAKKSTSTKTTSKSSAKTAKAKSTASSKKVSSTKGKTSSKSSTGTRNKKTTKKIESVPEKERLELIKQETIIEKIKSFLAKVIAMQEEARLEEAEKEKKVVKTKTAEKLDKKLNEKTNTSYMLEYYDLPYRYDETIVKILAQTPKRLFVYWDISDKDRQKYLTAFGEKFFEETYPVLLVHNEDKNYTFEVPINDFANSWYLDINDSKSKYMIELGRKFRNKPEIVNIARTEETKDIVLHNDYVPITSSNVLEVPNDHILFENAQVKVLYRNVKDNTETFIDIENNEFKRGMGHIYNIYDLYKEIYKNEIDDDNLFDLLNPSSMSSSAFK